MGQNNFENFMTHHQNSESLRRSISGIASCSVQYHKRCHDCGQFLAKQLWVRKDHPHKARGLCTDCYNLYDDPYYM